jgi:hypothetical protein
MSSTYLGRCFSHLFVCGVVFFPNSTTRKQWFDNPPWKVCVPTANTLKYLHIEEDDRMRLFKILKVTLGLYSFSLMSFFTRVLLRSINTQKVEVDSPRLWLYAMPCPPLACIFALPCRLPSLLPISSTVSRAPPWKIGLTNELSPSRNAIGMCPPSSSLVATRRFTTP